VSPHPPNSNLSNRYVLTGAPGAGKTSVLAALPGHGLAVVAEAATDVISARQARGVDEPWRQDGFIDQIVALQRSRLVAAVLTSAPAEVHDRSVFCTLALARFLGRPVTPRLAAEVARVADAGVFARTVFLLRPLGFIVPTAARRISYADALAFERQHEAAYREHGFELVAVPPAPVAERAALIAGEIAARS
jgi:predicted ATPase